MQTIAEKVKTFKEYLKNITFVLFDEENCEEGEINVISIRTPFHLEKNLMDSIYEYNKVLEDDKEIKESLLDEIVYSINEIEYFSHLLGMIQGVCSTLGYNVIVPTLYECEEKSEIKIKIY